MAEDTRKALVRRLSEYAQHGIEYRWEKALIDTLHEAMEALASAPAPQAGPKVHRLTVREAAGPGEFTTNEPASPVGTEGPGRVAVSTEMYALAIHLRDIGAPGESEDLRAMADRVTQIMHDAANARPDVEARLREYVQHKAGCKAILNRVTKATINGEPAVVYNEPCTCGLDAALTPGREGPPMGNQRPGLRSDLPGDGQK